MIEDTMWWMLWLIPFMIRCVDISCFLGECTEDERRKESFESVLNNHLSLNGFWWYHHVRWLHEDNEIPGSLNARCTVLQLLTSLRYGLFQQDGISKDYSVDPRDNVEGTKAKCHLFVNCCFYKYNTIKLHIFIGNQKDK